MLSSCKEGTRDRNEAGPDAHQSDTVKALPQAQPNSTGPTIPESAHVEVKAFKDSLGWGYELYVNGVKSIYQPLIPGVQGLQGFRSEKDAKKVGDLVAYKLTHHQMPNVFLNELDSLKIVYKRAEEVIPGKRK